MKALMTVSADPFAAEQCCMSVYSPCRVSDEELLHFLVSDPQSLDPRSGNLFPGAIQQIHLKGLSFLRDCASDAEFVSTFDLLQRRSAADRKDRFLQSIRHVRAAVLRYHGGNRFLGVIDTGYRDRPAHADVYGAKPSDRLERERFTRTLLAKLDANSTPPSGFRDGLLASYART